MNSPTPTDSRWVDQIQIESLVSGFDITASLVANSNGETVGSDGSSRGLGNATDLTLLKALRRKSDLVLTSGSTFRADEYRFPTSGNLAVLSRTKVSIDVPSGREFHALSEGYVESLVEMKKRYRRIHVEFGERGILDLVSKGGLDALFISSIEQKGVKLLAMRLGVSIIEFELSDLFVGLVAWQPNGVKALL